MKSYNFSKLTGKLITRDSFEYEESRKSWNRAIEKYPLAIVCCKNKEDIINAIDWSKENEVSIRIRSGAHNYEGFSTGNDVLVIDMQYMNNIYIDEEKALVKAEGGVRNREIYNVTGEMNYPFPGGGCPTVGVAGLILGGGWGYSSRLYGLSCDSVVQIELINYNGEEIIASENINKDLFWALKGAGGGNFGVVTSITFKLAKKVSNVTLINADFKTNDNDEVINIISQWQKEYKTLDKRFNGKISIYNSKENGKGAKFTALFYGNKEEVRSIIDPILNKATNIICKIEECSLLEANTKIQDSHPDYESYKSTGRFLYNEFSRDEIENLIDLISDLGEGGIYSAVTLYGLGGNVGESSLESSAFYHRGAKFIVGFQVLWEEAKYAPINKIWFLEKFKEIKKMTKGSFINFPLSELPNYEEEYFGDFYKSLKEIKEKYDPENIFSFPQGIR